LGIVEASRAFQEERVGYTEKQTNPSDTAECSKRIISDAKALGSS
jgi:hypothetical protein